MAGIAAVFDRSGTVSRSEFDAVFDALDHRGWDGADAVALDRVALGHHHAYTTPEEVGERQPVALDDLWVALDGRVDNRSEVLALLDGVDEAAETSDAELVLRAYRTLGEQFLDRLVGAFALAVWDPAEERLLLALDRTDIHRQLYYAPVDDAVVVASEMQAVVEHPAVSTALNERALGELLADSYIAPDETFYADVRTVEPGSLVEVTADGTRAECYWEPWSADVEVDAAEDVAEAFLDRLEEAVACRLRAPTLPGIQLSGGLDSTTVACVARRHLDRTGGSDDALHSFSLVRDDDVFEGEVERLRAVVEECDLESHVRRAENHYTLKDTAAYESAARESPVFNPILLANRALYADASDAGRTVLLTGIGGNMYDGNRFYYLDLLRNGRLGAFLRHARADPMAARRVLLWFVLVPRFDRVAALVSERYDEVETGVPAWMDGEFATRSGLVERPAADAATGFDTVSRELMYKPYYRSERRFESGTSRRDALRSGVELRNPFMDSRLVEFLFSIPSWELFEAGEDKVLVRRATEGILPEVVRTQSAAVHFDPVVDRGIRDRRREFVEELVADSRLAELGVVDGDRFRRRVRRYLDGDEQGSNRVWGLIATELWLEQRP